LADEKPIPREVPQTYQTGRRGGTSSSRRYLSQSRRQASGESFDQAWAWDRYCVAIARGLVLLCLVYSAWRFGGVDPDGQFHVSVLLGIASVLTLAANRSFSRKSRRLPVVMFSIALIWIFYALIQSVPVGSALGFAYPGAMSVDRQIAEPAVARLESAITEIDETQLPSRLASSVSVVPHLSRQAMVPYLLSFSVMVLSAILFESRESRTSLLWVLIVNMSLLAAWGIIQRAGGDAYILPGVENVFSNAPFSSFIYKNAGAAALLPGFAAIAAIFYGQRSGGGRSPGSLGSPPAVSLSPAFLLQPRTLTLIALASLLAAALIASLSRGAWFTALIAAVVIGSSSRFVMSKKQMLVLAGSAVLLILSVIALTGIRQTISKRANQVSVKSFSGDQRWDHWKDAAAAAWHYQPGGSGLGTFGFATLPIQTEPRRTWFREAHNQYLEVATEMGIVGIGLLVAALAWFSITAWRLLRQDAHREKSSWGLIGMAILLCGAIQSAFDFVLIIPANMMLYACLIGVVAAAERSYAAYRKSRQGNPSIGSDSVKDPVRKTELRYSLYRMPAVWVLVSGLLLFFCSAVAYRNATTETILNSVRASRSQDRPRLASIEKQIAAVDETIRTQPDRADLYRRRANLSFMVYRIMLIELAENADEQVAWQDTRPEALAATIAALDKASRETLLEYLLKTPEMRTQVAITLNHLAKSMQRNPLDPVTHATCLSLAPLTSMPVEPWVESCAKLNLNNPASLYSNGLVALQNGLDDLAIDQWSKSISAHHVHLAKIFAHATGKLPAIEIARHLIPSRRPDMFAQLVESADRESPMVAEDVAEDLIEYLTEEADFDEGHINAALAGIYHAVGDQQRAIEYWKQALESNNKNQEFRFGYVQALRRGGDYEEALKQSIFGSTLHPGDHRFGDLTVGIRQDISRQRDFD
tara:strand:+ start:90369 stop:93155 length:2787 start_codon:yes stop_codon:yes gene_type:complete